MGILFEKEACEFLRLPSIPVKEWDGKESFKDGIAVTKLAFDRLAYAVCTFDKEKDSEPRINKVFAQEPYYGTDKIFVVPSYMDTADIDKADLDEKSKEAAERLAKEAEELTSEGTEDSPEIPENEFMFDEIHNLEEAIAWLKDYNSRNKIKGRVPSDAETVKLRLYAIWCEQQNKAKE